MIKRLVEKPYYRVFPDRMDEHELAQMPIPVVKEERYRPEKIMVEVRIPRNLMIENTIPIEMIKESLAANLVDGIKEYMTINCCDDHLSQQLVYQGYIKILMEE
jgi:hypothetical protein